MIDRILDRAEKVDGFTFLMDVLFAPETHEGVRNVDGRIEVWRRRINIFTDTTYGGFERNDVFLVNTGAVKVPDGHWEPLKPKPPRNLEGTTKRWARRQRARIAEARDRLSSAWDALRGYP
jgi:hypothetical protein